MALNLLSNLITEPWATPNGATPKSCYPFKKKLKKSRKHSKQIIQQFKKQLESKPEKKSKKSSKRYHKSPNNIQKHNKHVQKKSNKIKQVQKNKIQTHVFFLNNIKKNQKTKQNQQKTKTSKKTIKQNPTKITKKRKLF